MIGVKSINVPKQSKMQKFATDNGIWAWNYAFFFLTMIALHKFRKVKIYKQANIYHIVIVLQKPSITFFL